LVACERRLDIRLSVITALIAAAVGILAFTEWGWIIAPIPFAAAIGAMFPKPIVSAIIGAMMGTAAAFLLFHWAAFVFGVG
jgi:hypothetical protein